MKRNLLLLGIVFFLITPIFAQSVFDLLYEKLFGRSYDVCESFNGKIISYNDFKTLLIALSKGNCKEEYNISLSFSISRKEFVSLVKSLNLNKAVIFLKPSSPLGRGVFVVEGNPGYYLFKKYDVLHISYKGEPKKDILIKVIEEGCDPYDDNCEVMCSFLRDVCDPKCYRNNQKEDVICDIDCVDKNKDGKIDINDSDGICDLDCYNNHRDEQNAYDIDCIIKNADAPDGICDPDTQGKKDGICDPDCAKRNKFCDPDCDGKKGKHNPLGLKDEDCYVCDGICNGFCSMACKAKDKDPDCPYGFEGFDNLTECCGNGICNPSKRENCETCPLDCPSGNVTCEDLGKVCCPKNPKRDDYGCINLTRKKGEGEECFCDSECKENFTCSINHCCPKGKFWDPRERKCSDKIDVLIISLRGPLYSKYGSTAKEIENKINLLVEAINKEGLGAKFLYLDDSLVEDLVGVRVTRRNWREVDNVLDLLYSKFKYKYLIIIGGLTIVPQAPVGSYTGSDDAYADIDRDGRYIPDIAVGRFPDPIRKDSSVILNALDTAIALHNQGGIVLSNYISPIMGCGGRIDPRPWNSGRCLCQHVWGLPHCSSKCTCLPLSSLNNKNFAVILAHGPGPRSYVDFFKGGCLDVMPYALKSINLRKAMWMSMACGGGYLNKPSISVSMTMSFLKLGGAIFIGSTNSNYGATLPCFAPGGDNCIGTFYYEIIRRFKVGKRVGDAFKEGKAAYLNKRYPCPPGYYYQGHIPCFYGDPTIKIKSMW